MGIFINELSSIFFCKNFLTGTQLKLQQAACCHYIRTIDQALYPLQWWLRGGQKFPLKRSLFRASWLVLGTRQSMGSEGVNLPPLLHWSREVDTDKALDSLPQPRVTFFSNCTTDSVITYSQITVTAVPKFVWLLLPTTVGQQRGIYLILNLINLARREPRYERFDSAVKDVLWCIIAKNCLWQISSEHGD